MLDLLFQRQAYAHPFNLSLTQSRTDIHTNKLSALICPFTKHGSNSPPQGRPFVSNARGLLGGGC